MNIHTEKRLTDKAKNWWNQRIGLIFVYQGRPDFHIRWDLEPIILIGDRGERDFSSTKFGYLLYMGENIFFSFGFQHKIKVYTEIYKWHKLLTPISE